MRIIHLSVYDTFGGGARSAFRLHNGLCRSGVDSRMLVRDKYSIEEEVIVPKALRRILAKGRARADSIPPRFYRHRQPSGFTSALLPDGLLHEITARGPDLVHLHWLGEGFLRPETLKRLRIPLIWTLHDSSPFTGGCHLPGDCRRFVERCGACPILGSRAEHDLSRLIWWRKHRAWESIDLTVVTPSRWMGECARRSSLFSNRRIEIIPNGIDTARYRPLDAAVARDAFGLPGDRHIVLYGAVGGTSDPNKGFAFLVEALRALAATGAAKSLLLVVAGVSSIPGLPDLGIPVRCVGFLRDDVSMALLYAAANLVVVPSRQENFPNAVLESLSCGRPVVAFRIGGMPDLIRDRINGVLVEPFDTNALAAAIHWSLEETNRWQHLSMDARAIAESELALHVQAQRYTQLYQEVLSGVTNRHPHPQGGMQ